MIIICDKCEGVGKVCWDEPGRNGDRIFANCNQCGGSGRVIKETTVERKPFRPEKGCPTHLR